MGAWRAFALLGANASLSGQNLLERSESLAKAQTDLAIAKQAGSRVTMERVDAENRRHPGIAACLRPASPAGARKTLFTTVDGERSTREQLDVCKLDNVGVTYTRCGNRWHSSFRWAL